MSENEIIEDSLLADIDVCVYVTEENRHKVERLILSIAEHTPAAAIHVADNAVALDRTMYRDIKEKAANAGLLERIIVHSLPAKTGIAEARNFFMNETNRKYKLFVDGNYEFTERTDPETMALVLRKHPTMGIVSGVIDKDGKAIAPEYDDTAIALNDVDSFCIAASMSPFAMVLRDLRHYIRYDQTSHNALVQYSNHMSRVQYQMAIVPKSIININTTDDEKATTAGGENKGNESSGAGDGGPTESNVLGKDGNGPGSQSAPIGQNAPSANTTARRR